LVEGDARKFAAQLPDEATVLATFRSGAAEHLVLSFRDTRLRVCVTAAPNRSQPAFVIPTVAAAPAWLDAAKQFCAFQAGDLTAFARSPFKPTLYQRARLSRLLAIADASAIGANARDVAFDIVFPNSTPLDGNDWRSSSEQRQTRRLIAEAARMIDGGFWRLPCFF
jgi:hypothetical protein